MNGNVNIGACGNRLGKSPIAQMKDRAKLNRVRFGQYKRIPGMLKKAVDDAIEAARSEGRRGLVLRPDFSRDPLAVALGSFRI
jgi:hypothetical protein